MYCERFGSTRASWRWRLSVRGLVNIQFAIQRGTVYVIEVNPRASRTVPYVSKATGDSTGEDCFTDYGGTEVEGAAAGAGGER